MKAKQKKQTLWNNSSVSKNIIPKDFALRDDQSIDDLFKPQKCNSQHLDGKPYETKFDERSLAHIMG